MADRKAASATGAPSAGKASAGGAPPMDIDALLRKAASAWQMEQQHSTCENCAGDDGGGAPATLYCKNCNGYLCATCDATLHPAANALLRKHQRVPVESIKPPVYCKDHVDEEVSYFCMTCECACVCTECVVHGPHKTHDVQNIRKALPVIRERAEGLQQTLQMRVQELEAYLQRIEEHKREIIASTQSIKESMAASFAEVRERLARKEEELMANADAFMNEQVGGLDAYIRAARDQADELDAVAEVLRAKIADSDAAQLLNYYAENRQLMQDLSLAKDPLVLELPQVAGRKCFLNMDSTNAQIDALNGLHLVIASLRADLGPSASPHAAAAAVAAAGASAGASAGAAPPSASRGRGAPLPRTGSATAGRGRAR